MSEVESFVTNMKGEMKGQKVSVAELSRRSGIPYGTLYDLISGRTSPSRITVDTSIAVAQALGTTVERLIGAEDKPVSVALSPAERRLVDLYRSCNEEGKDAMTAACEGIARAFPLERGAAEDGVA